jgi:hypothetical protein
VRRLTAEGRSAYPHFIDATGGTIIGRCLDDGATRTFRWSAAAGTMELYGDARGRIALDGDLLVLPGWGNPRGWALQVRDTCPSEAHDHAPRS